jgi:hypothetical protein
MPNHNLSVDDVIAAGSILRIIETGEFIILTKDTPVIISTGYWRVIKLKKCVSVNRCRANLNFTLGISEFDIFCGSLSAYAKPIIENLKDNDKLYLRRH